MAGRKPALTPSVIIEAVLSFRDRVISSAENNCQVVPTTNAVWNDLSGFLKGMISSNALHTFVQQGRHGILEKLGVVSPKEIQLSSLDKITVDSENGSNSEYLNESSDAVEVSTKKFVFTFTPEQWQAIKPEEVYYKCNDKSQPTKKNRKYYTLAKSLWTPLFAEHFWLHTKLPCCLSFKRSKAYPSGNLYVVVVGRCSECQSHFKGIISERPSSGSSVLINCTYSGNFEKVHKAKKRRLIGSAKENAIMSIVDGRISCESYREQEATRLMSIGDQNPPIIPTGNTLRIAKARSLEANRRHKDILVSLSMMKKEVDFKDVLHDMGVDPFFLHYHCGEQIHVYQDYCRYVSHPKLCIDATGSVVKNFAKLGKENTSKIFLYEAVAYDSVKQHGFTVTNMLSERHTKTAISNWLSKWLSCKVPVPKETVCDMSIALLSAISQCFTQFSSLNSYIQVCADFLFNDNLCNNAYWVPKCFIRIDVAHFIKNISKWVPLKTVNRRVREVILRTFGLIVKSQNLADIRNLLLSLFVVVTNETDGLNNGLQTPCNKYKNELIKCTSTGMTDFDEIINNLDDEEFDIEKENEGLDNGNPFESWAENIYNTSKNLVQEGTGINPFFLPSLVPLIIKCVKLLPLWSGVMIPIFNYGDETASSASVESSFKKLKTVTFTENLPTDIEKFLEQHILSLKGATLIHSTREDQQLSENITVTNMDVCDFDEIESANANEILPDKNQDDIRMESEINIFENLSRTNCPLCISGTLPSQSGAHKCIICKTPVHAISTCSTHVPEHDNQRICHSCHYDNNMREETESLESWNKKKKRSSSSYLMPNPHLRHLNLNNSRVIKSLPILKNGSRYEELKSCRLKGIDGRLVLSNTCAFDSLTSLIMTAYCDSEKYGDDIDSSIDYFDFIIKILQNGITAATYTKRAEIIMNNLNPKTQSLEYGSTLAMCDENIGYVIKKLLSKYPTAFENIICSNNSCSKHSQLTFEYWTYQTNIYNDLSDLQHFVNNKMCSKETICGDGCNGVKSLMTKISKSHLIFDILYWEGEEAVTDLRSAEAAKLVQIRLCDIPQQIIWDNITYELRGVVSLIVGKSNLRNSVGHYKAYVKRGNRNWEIHDDQKKKAIPVKEVKLVPCEYIMYTV